MGPPIKGYCDNNRSKFGKIKLNFYWFRSFLIKENLPGDFIIMLLTALSSTPDTEKHCEYTPELHKIGKTHEITHNIIPVTIHTTLLFSVTFPDLYLLRKNQLSHYYYWSPLKLIISPKRNQCGFWLPRIYNILTASLVIMFKFYRTPPILTILMLV